MRKACARVVSVTPSALRACIDLLARRNRRRRKFELRHLQCLRCFECGAFLGCRPGFWNDVFDLVIGHGWQARQYVVQISVGLDTVSSSAFDDRKSVQTLSGP